jgi:hypothetical protein
LLMKHRKHQVAEFFITLKFEYKIYFLYLVSINKDILSNQEILNAGNNDHTEISSHPTWQPSTVPKTGSSIPAKVAVPIPAPTNRPVGGATRMPTVPQSGCITTLTTTPPPSPVPSIVPTALPSGVTVAAPTATPSVKPSANPVKSARPTTFPPLPQVPLTVANHKTRVRSFPDFSSFNFSDHLSFFRYPRRFQRPSPVWFPRLFRYLQRSRTMV